MSKRKLHVLFIGSFKPRGDDGTVGGQGIACQSLIGSYLSDSINWLLIDTTQKTQPPPNVARRSVYAATRVLKTLYLLSSRRVDTVLIFSGYMVASIAEKGLIALTAKLFRKRVVFAIRSQIRPHRSDKYAFWYKRWVFRSCDQIVCQSSANVSAIENLFGEKFTDKVTIIPNWITLTEPTIQSESPAATDFTKDVPLQFMYLGWLIAEKGIVELVEAAHDLRKNGVNFHLHICGGGYLEEYTREAVVRYELEDNVTIHGWVYDSDKQNLLKKCQVLVLPSYREGMPNAILEGMNAGLAIVATNVGGIPSLVQSEEQGFLAPPEDSLALSNAMRRCIEDTNLVASMGQRNRAAIKKNHSLESVLPLFKQCLGLEAQ